MIKAVAAIVEREGRILIAKRRKDDPLKGKWEFPGGKVEDGETPEECLRRELQEELGADGIIQGLMERTLYEYDHVRVDLTFYRVKLLSREIMQKEYAEVKWVSPNELEGFDIPAANRRVIKILKGEEKGAKVSGGRGFKGTK